MLAWNVGAVTENVLDGMNFYFILSLPLLFLTLFPSPSSPLQLQAGWS